MGSSVPRLVGSHEIRVRLGGISRQRTYQITSKASFPKPLADLESGKVWDADKVEAWIAANRPQQDELDE
jgi:predicted DNA-binding transcriptional regulator AlpA